METKNNYGVATHLFSYNTGAKDQRYPSCSLSLSAFSLGHFSELQVPYDPQRIEGC